MDAYQKIATEMKNYFSTHKIFGLLIHWDSFIVFGSLIVIVFNVFSSVGSLVGVLTYYTLILGLLLAFANQNNQHLMIGLAVYAAVQVADVIRFGLFTDYRFLDISSLVALFIFGFFAYKLYLYTIKTPK